MRKILLLVLVFISCTHTEFTPIDLDGCYSNEDLEITFDNGTFYGYTKCNSIHGTYEIGNTIDIEITGTKVWCQGDFNIKYLRGVFDYDLSERGLIIHGSDYDVFLSKNFITLQ